MLLKVPTNTHSDEEDRHEIVAEGIPMDGILDVDDYIDDDDDDLTDHDFDFMSSANDQDINCEENDFSEYMWMMNEEEFDKAEMQRLEEQSMMEQCMQLMIQLNGARCPVMDGDGQTLLVLNDVSEEEDDDDDTEHETNADLPANRAYV